MAFNRAKSAVKNEPAEPIVEEAIQDGLLFLDRITVKKDFWIERNPEVEQTKKIMKTDFFAELSKLAKNDKSDSDSSKEMETFLELVSSGKRVRNESFHRFNLFVSNQIREKNIQLSDIAIFLEEDYFEFKAVLNCFNEENLYLLREEMAGKLPTRKTKLKQFIEVE
jgi:hypothetical protein